MKGFRRFLLPLWLCMICATVYSHNILQTQYCGLQDGGTYGLVDNLTYTYNGNHLSISHFFLKKIGVFCHSPTQYGILR